MKPIIVSVAGPSGAGKSFLASLLKSEHSFQEIVSTTTRAPREGEKDGVHYHFIDKEEFLKLDSEGGLVEKTYVNGNYYGVSKNEPLRLAKENLPIVLVAEPEGVKQVKKYCDDNNWIGISVFINSPLDVLMERLNNRMQEEIDRVNKDDPLYDEKVKKVTQSNMSRMKHIKDFELKNWVEPAYSKDTVFDLVFDEFNKSNEHDVISKIKSEIERKQKLDNTKKIEKKNKRNTRKPF